MLSTATSCFSSPYHSCFIVSWQPKGNEPKNTLTNMAKILGVKVWQIGCAVSQKGNLCTPPTMQRFNRVSGWFARLQLISCFLHSVQRSNPTTPALPCPKSSLAGSARHTPPLWEAACWPTNVNPDMTSAAPTSSPASGTSPGAAAPLLVWKVGWEVQKDNAVCSGMASLAAFRLPAKIRFSANPAWNPVVSFVVWRVATQVTSDFLLNWLKKRHLDRSVPV